MKARLLCCLLLVIALCLQFAPQPALAAVGDLDTTFAGFGTSGKVLIPGGYLPGRMVLQPNGKIVVVGSQTVAILGGHRQDLFAARFLSNGTPDPTFGYNGIATFPRSGYDLYGTDVAVQSDGKIIMTAFQGSGAGYGQDMWLLRLTVYGTPDTTFGDHGWSINNYGSAVRLNALAIQTDGKIVACGERYPDFAVARFNPDGLLDTTFASSGKGTIGFNSNAGCYDMALQDDGNIVLAGYTTEDFLSQGDDFAIARLNSSGNLDGSFDGDGKLTTDFGTDSDRANAITILPDGKLVVAGDNNTNALVARYQSNGALDGSLDGDGKRSISGLSGSINDVKVQPDAKIVLLGYHISPDSDKKFALYRLNSDGTLDASFDGDGDAFIDLGGDDRGASLALQADGRIIAYGRSSGSLALIRLWPNATFDSGGQQTLGFDDPLLGPGTRESGNGMALQTDGRIVVAGQISDMGSSDTNFAIARFMPDGQLDTSFGTLGRVSYGFGGHQAARAVAIQTDGKIVVAGYTYPISGGDKNFMVARFNANGSPDGHFGFGGFTVIDFFGGDDYGWALALAPDGKIVVAGTVTAYVGTPGQQQIFGVARLNSDGTADTSFAGTGKASVSFAIGSNHWASSVVVQSDSSVVVGGWVGTDFALVRFNAGGGIDPSFGTSGKTVTDMGGDDYLYALVLAGNGQIFAAGTRVVNGAGDFALAHYTSNGVLVTCQQGLPCATWPSGKWFVDFGGSETALALDIRGDGQLVAGGCSDGGFAWAQVSIAYHLSATTVAKNTTDFVGNDECAAGVKFAPPNKIILAGTQHFSDDSNFALARFETTQGPAAARLYSYLPLAIHAMNAGW